MLAEANVPFLCMRHVALKTGLLPWNMHRPCIFLQCRYEVRAWDLTTAIQAVQIAGCQGCVLKLIDNATAALAKDLSIGSALSSETELDLVIFGQPWRSANQEPLTIWDLNSHHLFIAGFTKVCFQNVLMRNGKAKRYGGAIQIVGQTSRTVEVRLQDCTLADNEAEVLFPLHCPC